jgi:hypothetical protein
METFEQIRNSFSKYYHAADGGQPVVIKVTQT